MTQNFAKILAAFVVGLVTVFGSALVYSKLQQRGEPVSAAQPARPEQTTPLAEPPAPAITPAHGLPESSSQADSWKQSTSSTTTVLLPAPVKNKAVGERHAGDALPVRPHESDEHNIQPVTQPASIPRTVAVSSAQVNSNRVPVPLVPNLNAAQQSKDNSGPEHHTPAAEQLQRGIAETAQSRPEPVRSEPVSKAIVVPASTTLEVRLSETLSSDRNRPGDTFRATLALPLVVDGYVLAETGATVLGRVETSHKAPLLGGKSELSVILTEIGTVDGQMTRVATGWRKIKGMHNKLTGTVSTALGAVTGAAKGAGTANSAFEEGHESRNLLAEPRAAVFPAGAQMTFILVAPFTATGIRPY